MVDRLALKVFATLSFTAGFAKVLSLRAKYPPLEEVPRYEAEKDYFPTRAGAHL